MRGSCLQMTGAKKTRLTVSLILAVWGTPQLQRKLQHGTERGPSSRSVGETATPESSSARRCAGKFVACYTDHCRHREDETQGSGKPALASETCRYLVSAFDQSMLTLSRNYGRTGPNGTYITSLASRYPILSVIRTFSRNGRPRR